MQFCDPSLRQSGGQSAIACCTVMELQKNRCGGPLYPSFLQRHGPYVVEKISEGPGILWLPCNSNAGAVGSYVKPVRRSCRLIFSGSMRYIKLATNQLLIAR